MLKTILHVIDTTGPGGAETVFIDLATRLPQEKYNSISLIRGKGWVYDELCRRGAAPILLDAKGSFNWRYLFGLCKIVRSNNVSLIQSHLLGANVYCSMAGLLTATPVVTTFHGSVDIGENERLKGLKFGVINAGADCIVAVSYDLLNDMLARTSLNAEKTQVISNGINTSLYQRPRSKTLRHKFGWNNDDIIVGSLGNLRTAKGYDVLLHSAALLKQSSQSFRFVIAGEGKGKLFDKLLELRKELGLEDKVHFLGFIDDAADFLSNLDMFLSSSISEGLPLSAIQAMVSNLPLIASRCGGYEELIKDRENGWLVEVGSPEAIAEAIESLASNMQLRKSLSDNARRYAIDTFDISTMLKTYQLVYDKLMFHS